jgi:hypothetical protein
MRSTRIWILLIFPTLLTCSHAVASDGSDSTKPVIRAVRIESDLELTGKLTDPRWDLAPPIHIDYEMQPGENTPAPQQTTVRVLFNSDYVYFGFDCKDTNPAAIRAHITDRDKMFDDDYAVVLLDTYGDYQRTYELMVNPYGIQGDLLRTGTNEDDSFDMLWKAAAAVSDSGWTAEYAIPFKSLRFPSRKEQRWIVMLGRNYPRASREVFSWTRVDRNNPCLICQGGILEGITGVQSVTSVDVLPYVVGQQSGAVGDDSDPTSSFENGKLRGRVGGGVRYAPSPDLAVEAVINPDFSQVESDATQISVNSTYALFYPEKRPFFLHGADLFQNQTNTYYSRTINNPLGAARIIGKSGSFSFGYLAASDRNTPFIIPGEESSDFISSDLKSFSNVARARYDFGKEDFIGGMVTTRNTGQAHNYLAGVDWNYKFWENYYFRGEVFYSDTKEVNDTSLFSSTRALGSTGDDAGFNGEQYGGASYQVQLQRDARDFSYALRYQDVAPTFQAQAGFAPRNNNRTWFLQENYSFYPNNAWLDTWSISANGGLHFNHDWTRKEKWLDPRISATLKSQTDIQISYFLVNDELFGGTQFNNINRTQVEIDSRPSTWLTLSFNGSFGRFIWRSDTPDMGTGHDISLSAQVKPTSQLQIQLSYARSRLSSVATGELFYDGYIARAVGIFQFTPELFLRLIGQYDQFDKAIDVYPLLSYKLNPYTIFYAGSTYSLIDFGPPFGVRQTSRQFFLKLQYLLRS